MFVIALVIFRGFYSIKIDPELCSLLVITVTAGLSLIRHVTGVIFTLATAAHLSVEPWVSGFQLRFSENQYQRIEDRVYERQAELCKTNYNPHVDVLLVFESRVAIFIKPLTECIYTYYPNQCDVAQEEEDWYRENSNGDVSGCIWKGWCGILLLQWTSQVFYLYCHTDQHNKRWKQKIRGTKSTINHITNMCKIIRLIKAGFLK